MVQLAALGITLFVSISGGIFSGWAALVERARNPAKFKMDVSDVVVADRPGYWARSMAINPTGKHLKSTSMRVCARGKSVIALWIRRPRGD